MRKFYLAANHLEALFLSVSFLTVAFWANATTYYSKTTGNANATATWGTNSNGTGLRRKFYNKW